MNKMLATGVAVLVLAVILLNLDAVRSLVFRSALITPPTRITVSLEGTPQRIDSNYLAANTRWTMTVTCHSDLLLSGYKWDVDQMINEGDYRAQQGEYVARKSLDIEITPTYTYMVFALEKRNQVTILEGRTGKNMDDRGDTVMDVRVDPLLYSYYLVNPTQPYTIVSPLKVRVNDAVKVLNFSTVETVEFNGVKFTQAGRLLPSKVPPDYRGFIIIPASSEVTGAYRDSSGRYWLVIPDGYSLERSLINPSSSTSYNAYVWCDDRGGYLEGLGFISPGPASVFGPDQVQGKGWGAAWRIETSPLWTSISLAEYPRGGGIFKSQLPAVRNGTVFKDWVGPLVFRQVQRLELPVKDFMTWLTDQVYVANPALSDPKLDEWFIVDDGVSPRLVVRYPSCYYPEMIVIQFPGSLADVVIYSPMVSSFQLVSVTTDITKVLGGQTAKVTATVKNTGEIVSTARVHARSEKGIFILDKDTYTLTLQPGQTGEAYFNAYYGGDQELRDRVIVTVKDAEGQVWGESSVTLETGAPIGGLFIENVEPGGAIVYGKWTSLVVKVRNKQGITYTDTRIVIEAQAPFRVQPASLEKECPPGVTAFEFQVTVDSTIENIDGTLKIMLYRGSTWLQTVNVGVTGNPYRRPPPTPVGLDIWFWVSVILIIFGIILIIGGALSIWIRGEGAGLMVIGILVVVMGVAVYLYLRPVFTGGG